MTNDEQKGRLGQYDLLPSSVHQRHIFGGLIIFTGLSANRPTNSPPSEKQAYYAYDSKVLSIWNTTTKTWNTVSFS